MKDSAVCGGDVWGNEAPMKRCKNTTVELDYQDPILIDKYNEKQGFTLFTD